MIYEQSQKEIIKIFDSLIGKHRLDVLFRDFITLAACTISNSIDKSQWEQREKLYMDTVAKYEKTEANKFAQILALVISGLSGPKKGDFIGELYMQLEISNKHRGQFFTPYNISKMMASLLGFEPNRQGIVELNEPAVGSGGMIVAYAEQMELAGYNYQTDLRVVCNDIDFDVVKMCYIQLSLLGIDAVVYQGDTISLKMNEVWYTPMHLLNKARGNHTSKTNKMVDTTEQALSLESDEIGTIENQMDIFEILGG